MKNIIKNFDEFVNEGLISDYKKQKEQEEKEITSSDRNFIKRVITAFEEIGYPYILVAKNAAVYSENVKMKFAQGLRGRVMTMKDFEDKDFNDIHISEKSIIKLFNDDDGDIKNLVDNAKDFKNIWKSIYKWFEKEYDKKGLSFGGKVTVGRVLEFKDDIKKDLL